MPDIDIEASVVHPPRRKDSRNDLMTSNRASGFPSVESPRAGTRLPG